MNKVALAKPKILVDRLATRGLMERLPSLMGARGITKASLIEATGINQPTIYALYKGAYKSSLSGDAMAAIAETLGVTLSELTGV